MFWDSRVRGRWPWSSLACWRTTKEWPFVPKMWVLNARLFMKPVIFSCADMLVGFRSWRPSWSAMQTAPRTSWWPWWTNPPALTNRLSHTCWTSTAVWPRPRWKTSRSSTLTTVRCLTLQIILFLPADPFVVSNVSCRRVHSDAIRPCGGGRLLHGLQFPPVCPASLCHHSLILWW